MPWCANPQCPHWKRTGKPAEYVDGVSTCKNCGHTLLPENPIPPRQRTPCPRRLIIRLLVTLGVITIVGILHLLPLPIADSGESDLSPEASESSDENEGYTVLIPKFLALGLSPFISAFIIVELIALAIPRFRRRRHGDPIFRKKLWIASLIGGVALGLIQGMGIATYLESIYSPLGESLVFAPVWAFRLQNGFVLMLGSCALALAAHLITRFGVGSGFATIILSGFLFAVPKWISTCWEQLQKNNITNLDIFVCVAILFGCLAISWWYLHLNDKKQYPIPIRVPTCGIQPIAIASSLLVLPVTLYNFFEWPSREFFQSFTPGTTWFTIVYAVLVVAFVPVFSTFFYWRRRKEFKLQEYFSSWRQARVYSALFLLGAIGVWYILIWKMPQLSYLFPSVVSIILGAALVADIWHEVRARWHSPGGEDLIPLESFQDVADALESNATRPKQNGSFIQGIYYRSLTYFFGPFVPLVILGVAGTYSPQKTTGNSKVQAVQKTGHSQDAG